MPASAFVTNAYQQGSGVESAQFGIYTTTTSSGFDSSGSTTVTTTAVTNSTATATATDATTASSTTTSTAAEATSSDVTSGGFGFVKRTNSNDEPAGYLVIGK